MTERMLTLGRMVSLERMVDAPPARVYRMWADADTMASWLCSEIQGSLLPGAESVLIFPRRRIAVLVLEATPNERFRFRWRHDDHEDLSTEVTIDLHSVGYGTRVALTDGPYDDGDRSQVDAWGDAIRVWSEALAQLRAQVDFSVDLRSRR